MMKGEASILPKATPSQQKAPNTVVRHDQVKAQSLFADALKRADPKPQIPKKKMVEDQIIGGSMTAPVDYAIAASSTTPSGPPRADSTMAAHIERIAAAIAEIAKSGASAEFHLQLPPGPTRIDGAVLGRTDAGQIHIVLTTVAAITPAASAQLQSQLSERLLRRDVKVAKMDLQRVNRRS